MKAFVIALLAVVLVPTAAQAHLSEDAFIEREIHRAFKQHDEVTVIKILPLLEARAEQEWERIDRKWDAEHVEVTEAPAPTEVPAATYTDSSNAYVDPWGCEADELHETDNPPYYGKYQFDRQTWYAHGGGSCYDSQSCTEAEQDLVASRVTYDAWPNC